MGIWSRIELISGVTDIARAQEAINKICKPLDAKIQEESIIRAGYVLSGVWFGFLLTHEGLATLVCWNFSTQ